MKPKLIIGFLVFLNLFVFGLSCKKQAKQVNLYWGMLGQYPSEDSLNPYKLTKDDKKINVAQVTFAIRRDYKTAEQISKETGIPATDIEKKMKELANCEMVREKDGKYIVNFPFWDEALKSEINNLALELAEKIVAVLKSELPNFKALFEKSTLPSQGYTWDDVSLTLIGGLLVDTGLNDRGLRERDIFDPQRDTPLRPGGYRYWYDAVENGWGGNYWAWGHNMICNKERDNWFGMFFAFIKDRRVNWNGVWDIFNDKRISSILHILIKNGSTKIGELQKEVKITPDSLKLVLQKMRKMQVIKTNYSFIYPNFPVFQESDIQLLFTKVDSVCDRVINDIYIPFLPKIETRWKKVKPKNWEMDKIDKYFIREVFNRTYNITLERLIRDGILPPPPIKPPFNWWGLNGYFKVI